MVTKSSCLHYVEGTATFHFPADCVGCDFCPCLETYARKQCRLTGEYLADTRTIGYMCPLNFKEEENDGKNV